MGGLLAWFLSRQIERQMATAASDLIGHQVTTMIRAQLAAADLREPMSGERYRVFDGFLRQNVLSRQIARIKVWNEAGTIIYADDPALVGQTLALGDELRRVYAQAEVVAELASLQEPENVAEAGMGRLLEIYVPLIPRDSETVLGAYEVYLYYEPIEAATRRAQFSVWGSVVAALAGLWAGLFRVFERASHAILRERELAITDPLTGLRNRRHLLEQMELENERSRRYRIPYSLILLDIDHFKR